jgi:hypothetical protein
MTINDFMFFSSLKNREKDLVLSQPTNKEICYEFKRFTFFYLIFTFDQAFRNLGNTP